MSLEITIRKYKWGVLRTITDRSATCVIHPEHWGQIITLQDGEATQFQDESGRLWRVLRAANTLGLVSRGTDWLVPMSRLAHRPIRAFHLPAPRF